MKGVVSTTTGRGIMVDANRARNLLDDGSDAAPGSSG